MRSDRLLEARPDILPLPGWGEFLAVLFDHLPEGMLLADASARLCHANQVARLLLEAGDGLRLDRQGVLRAGTTAETVQLHREIARSANPAADAAPLALTLHRREGQRPLQVLITPLPSGAMLRACDPDRLPALASGPLRNFYGLTAAEAAVAQHVVRGEGLREVATRLGLTVATVKTHLQHVFDKTGTRRQAELVRLLLGGGLLIQEAARPAASPNDAALEHGHL
jgi:DNA-binding CsgD family transcriptional regulator